MSRSHGNASRRRLVDRIRGFVRPLHIVYNAAMLKMLALTVALLIASSLVVAVAGGPAWDLFVRGNNDFRAFYAGAKLATTKDLYSLDANLAVQAGAGRIPSPAVAYIRPAFHALILSPLGLLPYGTAYWLYEAFGIACLCAFLYLFAGDLPDPRRVGLSGPAILCFLCAQDVFLILAAATASFVCARKRRDYLSGVALGLCVLKFHLFAFVPIVVLRHRRWKILAGAAAVIAALFGISLIASGLDWPKRYLAALNTPAIHGNTGWMPNFHGVAAALGLNPSIAAAASVAAAGLALLSIWRSRYEVGFAVALVAGVTANYHSYIYDCCLVMLAAPVLMREIPQLAAVMAEFIGPVPYILLFIPIVHPLIILFLVLVIAAPGFSRGAHAAESEMTSRSAESVGSPQV